MRRIALCLVAAAGFGAGVACGGDSTPPLSTEEFTQRSNAICEAGDAKLADAGKEILKNTTKPEHLAKFYLDHTLPNARDNLEEIKKLKPPEENEDTVKKMLAAGKKATESVEKGLKKQGPAYLSAKGSNPFKEFDETARELNLTACAFKTEGLQ
jgi:hypothetical protein